MKNEIINKKLIQTAYSKNIKVHIKLTDESWRNGFVLNITPDFFIFQDPVNGDESIFFLVLDKVEPYLKRIKKEGENGTRR